MNPRQDSSTVKNIAKTLTPSGKRFGSMVTAAPKKKKMPTAVGKAPVGKKKLFRGAGKVDSTARTAAKGARNGARKGVKPPMFHNNTGF